MGNADVIRIHERTRDRDADFGVCRATTASGRPCRNAAVGDHGYCARHAPRAATAPTEEPGLWERLAAFTGRRLRGDYVVDDFGYDPELSREVLLPLLAPLYDRYFRVKTVGIENIPVEGPALLVANHSGTIPLDAVIMQYAVAHEHPAHRVVRNVAATLAFRMPFIGPLARKTGNAVACDEDAHELLRRGELLGVFPEGFKGVGKGWRERYRLQRFGRGGFIEVALRAHTPVIPVAIVGAEEAYPMIADLRILAKAFGLPYFPVTPTWPLLGPLGALPLPSKWVIEFGPPIPMDEYPDDAAEDAMLVFELSDRIRDTIQQMLLQGVQARGGAFL